MNVPFSYHKESELFGAALSALAQNTHKQQISQFVSKENMQSFHHGRGWLTIKNEGTEVSELSEAGVELAIDYASIRNNDIQKFYAFINGIVEGFTSQIVANMFATISEACDKTGNVVKASDYSSKAEAFLQMLQTIEFNVNENGQVVYPELHLSPGEAKAFLDELNAKNEEFHKEVERIQKEKSVVALEREKLRLSKFKGIGK